MADKKYVEIDQIVMELKRFVGYLDADMLYRLEIAVKRLPAADVRPVVRGKWITHPRETWIGVDINGNETQPRQYFAYECPFCGFTAGAIGKSYNFCPNCGANMREES